MMIMRPPLEVDIEPLTDLWHSGWLDGHEAVVPAALARLRTRRNFRDRLLARWDGFRIAGQAGAPLGFHLVVADELNQFYVSATARGTGLASAMMADAESRFRVARIRRAWLSCSIGNERAARFYTRSGWIRTGEETIACETSEGAFPLDVWRYERVLD